MKYECPKCGAKAKRIRFTSYLECKDGCKYVDGDEHFIWVPETTDEGLKAVDAWLKAEEKDKSDAP